MIRCSLSFFSRRLFGQQYFFSDTFPLMERIRIGAGGLEHNPNGLVATCQGATIPFR